jgi:bifunctional oligoribonuclease and PAP phosphatase NrnA
MRTMRQTRSAQAAPGTQRGAGSIAGMTPRHDASPTSTASDEHTYRALLGRAARALRDHGGPIVVVSHVDPDGDAVGSVVALGRALRRLGKDVTMPMEPPRFLEFLGGPGELVAPIDALPEGTLLVVLDGDLARADAAPTTGAAFTINLDHHGTNPGGADIAVIAPDKAATALMVKELIDELGIAWDADLATPCLTGILTDTGIFRFGNTNREVLLAAADLIDTGVAYVELTDRLHWRHPDHFQMLAMVMATVRFDEGGALVTVRQTAAMRERLGATEDDSSDFVNVIRNAEGARVAAFLREVDDGVKVSVRSRGGVSAQAICVDLGGGGHVAAAGATLTGVTVDEAFERVRQATRRELARVAAA